MKIGIDLDNVLNTYDEDFLCAYMNNRHGELTWSSDDKNVNIFETFTNDEFKDILMKLNIKPYAYDATKELISSGHELYVVTSTYPENISIKHVWLKRYFPHLENLIMTEDKNMIKVDVLIDDSIKHIEEFSGHKIVFDRPNNRDCYKQYYRAFSWLDVPNIIKHIDNCDSLVRVFATGVTNPHALKILGGSHAK